MTNTIELSEQLKQQMRETILDVPEAVNATVEGDQALAVALWNIGPAVVKEMSRIYRDVLKSDEDIVITLEDILKFLTADEIEEYPTSKVDNFFAQIIYLADL